jgi:hypothetical protein
MVLITLRIIVPTRHILVRTAQGIKAVVQAEIVVVLRIASPMAIALLANPQEGISISNLSMAIRHIAKATLHVAPMLFVTFVINEIMCGKIAISIRT